ncbi:hypothetical protein Tco_0505277 [Tanacetum coccineum]
MFTLRNDVKGIITRGGRTTFVVGPNEANNEVASEKPPHNEQNDKVVTQDPDTNSPANPPKVDHVPADKPSKPSQSEVLFPNRVKKDKEDA